MKRFLKAVFRHMPVWLFNCLVGISSKRKNVADNGLRLETISPDNGGDCFANNILEKPEYDLLVIIPCYNAEKYIEKCAESILMQDTSFKVCVRFINDGSTDNTKDMLDSLVSNNNTNISIEVLHKENSGAASTRNSGLKHINARYIMFIDADDYLLGKDAFQFSISLADSIQCDSKIIEFDHSNNSDKEKGNGALKKCLYRDLNGFSWAKIYSSKIFEKVCFPEGYWFEDTANSFVIYPLAKEVYQCKKRIYCYMYNDSGSTSISKNNNRTVDTIYVTRKLIENRKHYSLNNDEEYGYRIALQTICNCMRMSTLSEDAQIAAFYETKRMFENNDFPKIKRFNKLYESIEKGYYSRYLKFSKLYTKIYIS